MKEAFWGIFIILLGSIGIVAINLFQSLTVSTDQNYYLMKEVTKAAMADSVDISYYRALGKPRIVKDAFVENLTRRFASSVILNSDYKIVIHDIVEQPPKVSLSLLSNTTDLQGEKYNILLNVDSVYEGMYGRDVLFDESLIKYPFPVDPIPTNQNPYDDVDGKCPNSEVGINECISGDLQFVKWGDISAINQAICPEDIPGIKSKLRDAIYKECDCGKWSDDKTEVVTSVLVRTPQKVTHEWTFIKDGPVNDINTKTKQEVSAGICTAGLEILIEDDPPFTISGGVVCPPEGINILVGQQITLYPRYIPKKSTNRDLKWSTNGEEITLGQDRGGWITYPDKDYVPITGKREGYANVTATSSNDKSASCKVTVYDLNDFKCPSESVQVLSGSKAYAILNNNLKINGMKYSITNTSLASINDQGEITTVPNLTAESNITYTISTNNKSVDCNLKILPLDTEKIVEVFPANSLSCSAGSIQSVKWNVSLPTICPQNKGILSALTLLKIAKASLNVKYCGHSAPINNCRSVWDVYDNIYLGGDSSNSRVGAVVNYYDDSYKVEVTSEVNHNGWQDALIGCTAKSTSTTFRATFTGKYSDSRKCLNYIDFYDEFGIDIDNSYHATLSVPSELMIGDKPKIISLSGTPDPKKSYSIRIYDNGAKLKYTSLDKLPVSISFVDGMSGTITVELIEIDKNTNRLSVDTASIALNSKVCAYVGFSKNNPTTTVNNYVEQKIVNTQDGLNTLIKQGAVWSITTPGGTKYLELGCSGLSNICNLKGISFDDSKTDGKTVVNYKATIESQCTLPQTALGSVSICPQGSYFCNSSSIYSVLSGDKCINTSASMPAKCSTDQITLNGKCYVPQDLPNGTYHEPTCPSGSTLQCAVGSSQGCSSYFCGTTKASKTCVCPSGTVTLNSKCYAKVDEVKNCSKHTDGYISGKDCYYDVKDKTCSCPSGTTKNSLGTCYYTVDYKPAYYTCDSGGTLVNASKCVYTNTPDVPKSSCDGYNYYKYFYDGNCYNGENAKQSCTK